MRPRLDVPVTQDLVLVGGGHAHVHVLKMWGMQPLPGVQLTLVTRDLATPYSGMLPGHIAGHYTREQCHIDLTRLACFAGARLVHSEACDLDPVAKKLSLKDGRPPLPYDVLSLDIGSSPQLPPTLFQPEEAPSAASASSPSPSPNDAAVGTGVQYVTPVKPIDGLSRRWDAILERVARWHHQPPLPTPASAGKSEQERFRVLVVGGGAAGVELAMALEHRLRPLLPEGRLRVTLLTKGPDILPGHNPAARRLLRRALGGKGIEVAAGAEAAGLVRPGGAGGAGGALLCTDGRRFAFDECLWCTEGAPAPWLAGTGLALDPRGFVAVAPTFQSTSHAGVFAAGDICAMLRHPRPKAGVFAVRAGPPLLANLRRALLGQALRPFTPQSTFLSLISTGGRHAVASKGGWAWEGAWLWGLKDWIDRKFMRMYQELPPMQAPPPPPPPGRPQEVQAEGGDAIEQLSRVPANMRCGGCGSKVGATTLSRALASLPPSVRGEGRSDIVTGLGDDAAVLRPFFQAGGRGEGNGSGGGMVQVQTVDFFKTFSPGFDPFLFGQIAANHALSDCHAMNARPTTALALAVVPHAGEEKVEAVLTQLLAGAGKVLEAAGCALVGGHTSEGAELALGFSVTGEAPAASLLHKGRLSALSEGMALILTKPLGTGAVLRAGMLGEGRAAWLQDAVGSMLQSNGPAAALLHGVGQAGAATDVTGFGLLGHLYEMLKAPTTPAAPTSDDQPQRPQQQQRRRRARVYLEAVPLLEGAAECAAAGILSSLQPANLRLRRLVFSSSSNQGSQGAAMAEATRHRSSPLLFDPQTAGGLLAAVPAARAEETVEALRAAGYERAAVIGELLGLEEEGAAGEGGQSLIELVVSPKA